MSKNLHTGATMITKPSSTYSDNYDSIFRKPSKVYYAVEYTDGVQDYLTFESDDEANEYYIINSPTFKSFEKQQLLQE